MLFHIPSLPSEAASAARWSCRKCVPALGLLLRHPTRVLYNRWRHVALHCDGTLQNNVALSASCVTILQKREIQNRQTRSDNQSVADCDRGSRSALLLP